MPSDSNDLLDFVNKATGENVIRIEKDLGSGFVRLNTSEAERRQAKHDISCVEDIVIELLRNSRDAGAKNVFVSSAREDNLRTLTVIDDGQGVPEHLQERIFEPRVTSKLDSMKIDTWGVHGRGMALFSIKSNSKSAKINDSIVDGGASVTVIVDTEITGEKSDQSTWPSARKLSGEEPIKFTGPHNLIRTIAEFAYENKGKLNVYLGSPSEVAKSIFDFGQKRITDNELFFYDDLSKLPLLNRFAGTDGAEELSEQTKIMGLDISDRTAHRILQGLIAPAKNVGIQVDSQICDTDKDPLLTNKKPFRLSESDKDLFSRKLEEAFEVISSRYYVELLERPKISASKNGLSVSFFIDGSS